ncbi:MAG TPA: M67 family metallopeptidase [Isosphaeraceae bacterium]|nr:M67 family metallopeptidase [Isosphaeraceae bacterium]
MVVPADVLEAMVEHCRREAPVEACGLLGGLGERVESCHPLRNVAASESRYDADGAEVIEVNRALREDGRAILAIYHSHPRWRAVPSRVDLDENHWGEMPRIIVSLLEAEPEVRAWRLGPDSFEEIPLRAIPPAGP